MKLGRTIRALARAGAAALTLLITACGADQDTASGTSLLITEVRVVDGSGSPAIAAAVRVTDGVITAVGDLDVTAGDVVFDGGGLTLAPGFIDTHSHADVDIFEHPDAFAAVSQGITTVVVGQDGGAPYPLVDFIAQLDEAGTAINIASYVGHNTIRDAVLGDDVARVADDAEIAAMQAILAEEMNAGALGLSTGLEYEPGIHSDTSEVIALAQTAADLGGRYISHLRSEDRWLEDAIDEILEIGRVTGMPVQISHFKLAMSSLWGRAPELLQKLDAARDAGIDVTADVYPYEYWQSTMMVLLPERDPADREAVEFALEELAPPEGMWFTRFEPNPEYVGMTLSEIADALEIDPVNAFTQLAEEALQFEARTGERAEAIIGTSMFDQDIRDLLAWEHSNICTDGALVDLHPRGIGSFPRVLGRYARDLGLMTLEQAVHKSSGLAAVHMGFADRGYIREGLAADLVLFDPDTIIDSATPEAPDGPSSGIAAVWVAGELVFEDGRTTGATPGRFLRH